MPLPTERLNRRSSKKAIDRAIAGCHELLHKEHPDWPDERISAACYADARRHAGGAKVPRK